MLAPWQNLHVEISLTIKLVVKKLLKSYQANSPAQKTIVPFKLTTPPPPTPWFFAFGSIYQFSAETLSEIIRYLNTDSKFSLSRTSKIWKSLVIIPPKTAIDDIPAEIIAEIIEDLDVASQYSLSRVSSVWESMIPLARICSFDDIALNCFSQEKKTMGVWIREEYPHRLFGSPRFYRFMGKNLHRGDEMHHFLQSAAGVQNQNENIEEILKGAAEGGSGESFRVIISMFDLFPENPSKLYKDLKRWAEISLLAIENDSISILEDLQCRNVLEIVAADYHLSAALKFGSKHSLQLLLTSLNFKLIFSPTEIDTYFQTIKGTELFHKLYRLAGHKTNEIYSLERLKAAIRVGNLPLFREMLSEAQGDLPLQEMFRR